MQVGADLVGTALLDGVALGATSLQTISTQRSKWGQIEQSYLEEVGALASVAC